MLILVQLQHCSLYFIHSPKIRGILIYFIINNKALLSLHIEDKDMIASPDFQLLYYQKIKNVHINFRSDFYHVYRIEKSKIIIYFFLFSTKEMYITTYYTSMIIW